MGGVGESRGWPWRGEGGSGECREREERTVAIGLAEVALLPVGLVEGERRWLDGYWHD